MIIQAVLFEGQLTSHSNSSASADGTTTAATDRPHVVLRNAIQTLEMVLWGYAVPSDQFKMALQSVKDTIRDPLVPLYEVCKCCYMNTIALLVQIDTAACNRFTLIRSSAC
jgi:Acetyl-CoA carboxylase, central region